MEIKSTPSIQKVDLAGSLNYTDQERLKVQGLWARSQFSELHKTKAREIKRFENGWWASHDYLVGSLGQEGSLFILSGPRGTGKTQICACLGRLMCLKMQPTKYIRASDLYMEIKDTFSAKTGEKKIIQDLGGNTNSSNTLAPRLLVIDEMQDRGGTAWEDRILNQIIDARYGGCLDTILITNDRKDVLHQTLGPSIISRADETGGIICTDWTSFRAG